MVLSARLRTLRNAGFRVLLVSSPGDLLWSTAARERVEPIAIPMERGIAPLADLLSLFRLWRLLGVRKPDLVEFSTPKAGLLGTLAAKLRRVPRRVYMLRGLKLETNTGLKRLVLLFAERLASACANVVLCNSQSLRTQALALRIAPVGKLELLGDGSSNGVDVERFSPGSSQVRARLGISPEALVVGFAGRLTQDKGLPDLVKAFNLILQAEPTASLLLVGWFDNSEDALDLNLRARIRCHPHIYCTGFVNDTAPYYRAMDVLVLPTLREGFPNVVLEAASTGIPVVTTDCTGACDSLVPNVTGLLVSPRDSEALSEAVLRIIRNPQHSRRMGQAARSWVLKHYPEERVVNITADYYRSLLEMPPLAKLQRA
jgi:glycosyltransferase involved in cell wall biosynthesis